MLSCACKREDVASGHHTQGRCAVCISPSSDTRCCQLTLLCISMLQESDQVLTVAWIRQRKGADGLCGRERQQPSSVPGSTRAGYTKLHSTQPTCDHIDAAHKVGLAKACKYRRQAYEQESWPRAALQLPVRCAPKARHAEHARAPALCFHCSVTCLNRRWAAEGGRPRALGGTTRCRQGGAVRDYRFGATQLSVVLAVLAYGMCQRK
jgi:hypothetical protein